jgi:hypothetical protein
MIPLEIDTRTEFASAFSIANARRQARAARAKRLRRDHAQKENRAGCRFEETLSRENPPARWKADGRKE